MFANLLYGLLLLGTVKAEDCFDNLFGVVQRPVAVHLFEWKWQDIAAECENYLQHTGFGYVQVSPPNEHILFEHDGDYSWWLRYQPISYKLESRSGSRQQFIDMVERCHKVGIRIIVDSVINHMCYANHQGYGSGGSFYNSTPFVENFEGVPYGPKDFNDDVCDHNIENYNDAWQVRNCRLVSLLDLKLSSPQVRGKIAAYLNDLVDLGVVGFRIDAAKHMYPEDLKQILNLLKPLNAHFHPAGGCPFIFHEVIDQGPEAIRGDEYTSMGRITNFRYGLDLTSVVNREKNFKHMHNFGEGWGYWAEHDVLVFVDNHDNQRGSGGGGSILTYKDGDRYVMAVSFMLAWPYGIPRVMSSYYFEGHDMGPPSTGKPDFKITGPSFGADGMCDESSGWVCEHRWPSIRRMTLFRQAVAEAPVLHVTREEHRLAFSRGDRGFFAVNNDPTYAWVATIQTALEAGLYCDMISGEIENSRCTGNMVQVDNEGKARLFLASGKVMAIGPLSKMTISPSFQRTVLFVREETKVGDNLFIVGGTAVDSACKPSATEDPCAIPIMHFDTVNKNSPDVSEWMKNDQFLDWYGEEEEQGEYENEQAEGTPLKWTTNVPGHPMYNPLNKFGEHYWMLDVMMDCSRTQNGWFQFKTIKEHQMEGAISQKECVENGKTISLPFASGNHIARCGFVNLFNFDDSSCQVEVL